MSALGQKRTLRCKKACPLCPLQRPRKRTSAKRHACFAPESRHLQRYAWARHTNKITDQP